jgi:hypothetical protein
MRDQDGVASRRQLLGAGVTPGRIRHELATGRWQLLATGVYATFSGPVPPRALVWAAVLRAGDGAAAGPRSSLWLTGALDNPPARPDVVVPSDRHLGGAVPFRIYRRLGLDDAVQHAALPPRLRVEDAVLESCREIDRPEAVVDLVLRVIQRRLTTADRLLARLSARRAHRWRALLLDVLGDAGDGVRSPLELRWLHHVQRAHGLPEGALNRLDLGPSSRAYRDVEFLTWGLVVELDGQEAHPDDRAFRDRRRDNTVTVTGRRTLRYGWHEIVADPCGVAAEVAEVLRGLGWPGRVTRCGPDCRLVQ